MLGRIMSKNANGAELNLHQKKDIMNFVLKNVPNHIGDNMKKYREKQLLEDIYDWVKICAFSDNQSDGYAELSRIHANESKRIFTPI